MYWHQSLTLSITTKTHIHTNEYFLHFFTYCGKFFCLSHYLYTWQNAIDLPVNTAITFNVCIKAKTQTWFMVLFTSGSSLSWGESPGTSSGISPRYFSAIYFQQSTFHFFTEILWWLSSNSSPIERKGRVTAWGPSGVILASVPS